MDDDCEFPLESKQVADFHCDGFLVVRGLAPADEVAELRHFLDREILMGTADPRFRDPTGIQADSDRRTIKHAESTVRQLFGDRIRLTGARFMFRPVGDRHGTPWHQEIAFGSPEWYQDGCTVWMPLQDVDAGSGCMRYIPGSHRHGGVYQHHQLDIEPGPGGYVSTEAIIDLEAEAAVDCPLAAGDAVLHQSATLHGANPNGGADVRRAYILSFGGRSMRRPQVAAGGIWEWNRQREEHKRAGAGRQVDLLAMP